MITQEFKDMVSGVLAEGFAGFVTAQHSKLVADQIVKEESANTNGLSTKEFKRRCLVRYQELTSPEYTENGKLEVYVSNLSK